MNADGRGFRLATEGIEYTEKYQIIKIFSKI
jgi:hypothetical protein